MSGKRNTQKNEAKKSVTTNRFQEKYGKHHITATGHAAVAIGGNASATGGDIIESGSVVIRNNRINVVRRKGQS